MCVPEAKSFHNGQLTQGAHDGRRAQGMHGEQFWD
jgi:hypothetical protein